MKKARIFVMTMLFMLLSVLNLNNTEAGTESSSEKVKVIINEDGKADSYYFDQTDDNVYEITVNETADNSEKENEKNKEINSVWIIILILSVSLLFKALVMDILNY